MNKIVIAAIAFLLCTTSLAAAECDTTFEAELRVATEGMKSLEQARRRLQSRLDGQDFRINKLGAGAEALPAAPVLPELGLPEIVNGEGCTMAPARQSAAVASASAAMDLAKTEVEARDRLLSEAESKAKSAEPALAAAEPEAAPVPEAQEAPAAIEGAAGEGAATPGDTASGAQRPQEPAAEAPAETAAVVGAEESAPAEANPAEGGSAEGAAGDPAAVAAATEGAGGTPAAEDAPAMTGEATAAEEGVTGPMPLTDPKNADAFIRVIAQPGMLLYPEAGSGGDGTEIPVFSILYVFERQDVGGEGWIRIGRTVRGGPEGWARAEKGVDWTTMLVMEFAPRGKRQQVLFFEDESALNSLVSGPFFQREARSIYDSIADQRGQPDPQWDSRLVAIEPQTAVTYDAKPYLLPILDWRSEMFDGTTDTTLVRVAALPAAPAGTIGARDDSSFTNDAEKVAQSGGAFRVGVVFVIDTTISMRPFIERTQQAVEEFYAAFSKYETASYVSFSLVGFRDDISHNPEGLEYVTKVFQPLDPEADPSTVLANISRMTEARVPTTGFAEDAIAGLVDAVNENDWAPYDARIIVLVTDASARMGEGTKYPNVTLEQLNEHARRHNITLIPLHLLTPANSKGDAAIAREQYSALARTGDIGSDKYIPIDATSDREFSAAISRLATEVAHGAMVVNAGELMSDDFFGDEPFDDEGMEPEPGELSRPEDKLSAVISNEIFRAQLESLGKIDEGAAPAFLSGWASDRDLTSPETETLEVSAFLTRNQLSTLDMRLDAIITAFRSGGDNPQTFFANLQKLAAETATDPENIRSGDSSTIEAILPSFLKNLPYRSQVLRLDQAYWGSMSVAQQQEFIESLESKRKIYKEIFSQTSNWADFGAGDPGLEATPVRLIHLP